MLWIVTLKYMMYAICRTSFGNEKVGRVAQQLYTALTRLQMGIEDDNMGWIVKLK